MLSKSSNSSNSSNSEKSKNSGNSENLQNSLSQSSSSNQGNEDPGNVDVKAKEIYLIERPVDQAVFKHFAFHQVLLITSIIPDGFLGKFFSFWNKTQYHILEYNSESKVNYFSVNGDIKAFLKNYRGIYLIKDCSKIDAQVKDLIDHMKGHEKIGYNLVTHNCRHVAQETFCHFGSKLK